MSTETQSLFTRTFWQDPYPVYRRLRQDSPVVCTQTQTGLRVWVVTRYEDARAVLTDPRLSKDLRRRPYRIGTVPRDNVENQAPEEGEILTAHLLNFDPPEHTRLRRLVSKEFTPRRVERLRPRVERISAELVAALAQRAREAADGVVDLLDGYAFPLPITVICELLGVPVEDRADFRAWSNALLDARPREEMLDATVAVRDYLQRLVAAKRAHPGDDLLSALVHTADAGDRLTEAELVSMAFLLLIAGHETTVNLIGNGVLLLLQHPDQLAALRADPGLLPGAVEELLRHDGPVSISTLRYTLEPVRIGDVEIPAGEFVEVALGSANRDERRFDDPDRLDITRPTSGHLAFGHGIHYCLGAHLARLEGEVALRDLLDAFPDLALAVPAEELRWRNSLLIRGLEELPVRPYAA
ncbi:MAG TPA: cytochrome P450 [Pseudonocardiaceae bacterium]